MSTASIEAPTSPSRDAASKEREERLNKARKKLKSYRARQSKGSTTSTSSVGSTASHTRRDSAQSQVSSVSTPHRHRKSQSRNSISSLAGAGIVVGSSSATHARKVSMPRAATAVATRPPSISRPAGATPGAGHGHTRSRASLSISVSAPITARDHSPNPPEGRRPSLTTPLSAPMSWSSSGGSANGSFPSTPNPPLSAQSNMSASSHHTTNSSFSNPPPSALHNRRASRHNRRSSVANLRESLEVVSGQGQIGQIQPAVSSFAPSAVDTGSPLSPSSTLTPLASAGSASNSAHASPAQIPSANWSNDPAKVLEALKERGRKESDYPNSGDPEKIRMDALEALEGRLSEPSPIIDLGNQAEGELMHAPPSPGYTSTAGGIVALPPASPSMVPFSSPMVGLGLGTGKRNSWSAPGPVTAAGAKGAMDLGMLAEEDEDEEEDDFDAAVARLPHSKKSSRNSSKSSRNGSPRKRPASLFLPPTSSPELSRHQPIAVGDDETPLTTGFASKPMRLSLSLSSAGSSEGTPSTAASFISSSARAPPALKSFTLAAPTPTPTPISAAIPEDSQLNPPSSPNGEKRSVSLFHSVAVTQASTGQVMVRTGSHSPTPPSATSNRGLRELAIGGPFSPAVTTGGADAVKARRASTTGTGPRGQQAKRSSISYRTTSVASLASPEGPLSASAQAARRPWRTSMSSTGTGLSSPISAPIPSSTIGGYAFPFVPAHGNMGGFGDLEVDETDNESPFSPVSSSNVPPSEDPEILAFQVNGLRSQMEQMKLQATQVASTHALEIAEFEKKAGEEARGMRMRIGELERQVDEGRIGRRFEVEGLSREIEQAREAISDLTEERDALREDVEGWRERCTSLEAIVKKDREDDALATAQAKLIGEMRDQIYNLVAALERERGEHTETRQEVERLLTHQQQQQQGSAGSSPREHHAGNDDAAVGRHHTFNNISDGSMLSTSSFGRSFSGNTTEDTSITTDLDDSFSKMSSPSSGHSSFGQAVGFPAGAKSRDSDYGAAALNTLAEEEEEDEEAAIGMKEDRVRLGSGSTGSTTSDNMPLTPSKEASMAAHQRSGSFVRHWSFPKGSVSSVRISIDDHSFFDLGRHTSLPALPIPESILPPFLCGDLTVDEDQIAVYEPVQHVRRPSSPRPLDRMQPHSRRFSGQYASKVPPVSPSALAHAALQTPAITPSKLSKLSFGNLIGTLGGWSPTAVSAPAGLAKLAVASTHEEEEEEDVFVSATRHQTPPSLLHSSLPRPKYIKAGQQPRPKASRLGLLDFTPICCADERIVLL